MRVHEMIARHPHVKGSTNYALLDCIERCYDCSQACTACADACLGEPMVKNLVQCIRLSLDCADICAATGSIASRRSGSNESLVARVLEACGLACQTCGEECEKHAQQLVHCRICSEACRECAVACQAALRSLQRSSH